MKSAAHLPDRGELLHSVLLGRAVEPAIGPRMLAPAEALLARILNLAAFDLAEVALSVQVPATGLFTSGIQAVVFATLAAAYLGETLESLAE